MESAHFDVVAVYPTIQSEGDGVRFVRLMKCLLAQFVPGPLCGLGAKYTYIPFVILPLPDDDEFAVFRTGQDWFLCDRPLGITIATLGIPQPRA